MGWWQRFKSGLAQNPNDKPAKRDPISVQKPSNNNFGVVLKQDTPEESKAISPVTLRYFDKPIFIDIETTGLHSDDRIVSISILRCNYKEDKSAIGIVNLVFDPLKKSHPMAENVHKLDDWMLRHQELFGEYVDAIGQIIEECDCIIAHNAKFDVSFLEREFQRWGKVFPKKPIFCTMTEASAQGWYPVNLAACARRLNIERQSSQHLAVEDAIMCMSLWRHWLGLNPVAIDPAKWPKFTNMLPIPERPAELPRRNNKKKLAIFSQKQLEEG